LLFSILSLWHLQQFVLFLTLGSFPHWKQLKIILCPYLVAYRLRVDMLHLSF
jgi:hypothetical protein